MSSFGGISTALTALQAHRRAMDVTGNNIANVNTAGYTRQRVDLVPREAPGASSLFYNTRLAGSGVEVLGTTRMADEFLTARVRDQTSTFADLQARAQSLKEVERTLAEPSGTGLSQSLSDMWNAWSTLGAHPDDTAAKTVVVNTSQRVVDSLKSGRGGVERSWTDQRAQAEALGTEVNQLASRIARLNDSILNTRTDGSANELLDQRDQLVTRMVELTGATAVPTEDRQVGVYLGGKALVTRNHSFAVVVDGSRGMDAPPGAAGTGVAAQPVKLAWADPATGKADLSAPTIVLGGGQLNGTFASLNATLPGAAAKYDEIARSLATTVNGGYAATGDGTFFSTPGGTSPTNVAELAIRASLAATPSSIAARTSTDGPKSGSAANAIGTLRTSADGPDAAWRDHVVKVGVDVAAATSRASTVQATLSTAIADQQSATGVSLDEETANLLVQQRAYEGAARVLTAVDQALDTLINRTGLVGR